MTGPHDAHGQDPHLPMRYDAGRWDYDCRTPRPCGLVDGDRVRGGVKCCKRDKMVRDGSEDARGDLVNVGHEHDRTRGKVFPGDHRAPDPDRHEHPARDVSNIEEGLIIGVGAGLTTAIMLGIGRLLIACRRPNRPPQRVLGACTAVLGPGTPRFAECVEWRRRNTSPRTLDPRFTNSPFCHGLLERRGRRADF